MQGIAKKVVAVLAASVAVTEHGSILWYAHQAVVIERTWPYPDDMQIGYLENFVLWIGVFISTISACGLYGCSWRWLADRSDRVLWTAIAMALSPWTTGLSFFFPALLPWPIEILAGIVAPYAITAA